MTSILLTLLSAVLISNLVLQAPVGVDPLLHGSSDRKPVHALGLATAVLMLVSGVLSHVLYHGLLEPLALTSLRLFVLLPICILLIHPLLRVLQRLLPAWPFDALWPLLLGNAGILGVALLATRDDQGLLHSAASSLGAGLGFWLVLSLFSDLRQRISTHDIPLPFRGLPVELISLGLMAVAFMGFNGLIKP